MMQVSLHQCRRMLQRTKRSLYKSGKFCRFTALASDDPFSTSQPSAKDRRQTRDLISKLQQLQYEPTNSVVYKGPEIVSRCLKNKSLLANEILNNELLTYLSIADPAQMLKVLETRPSSLGALPVGVLEKVLQACTKMHQVEIGMRVFEAAKTERVVTDVEYGEAMLLCRAKNKVVRSIEIFNSMPDDYKTTDVSKLNLLRVRLAAKEEHVDSLTQDFKSMENVTISMWKVLIQDCQKFGNVVFSNRVNEYFANVLKMEPDEDIYNLVIQLCDNAGDYRQAHWTYEQMLSHNMLPTVSTYKHLFRCSSVVKSRTPSWMLMQLAYFNMGLLTSVIFSPGWYYIATEMNAAEIANGLATAESVADPVQTAITGSSFTLLMAFGVFRSSAATRDGTTSFFQQLANNTEANRSVRLWRDLLKKREEVDQETITEFINACGNKGRSDLAFDSLFPPVSPDPVPSINSKTAMALFDALIRNGGMYRRAKTVYQNVWSSSNEFSGGRRVTLDLREMSQEGAGYFIQCCVTDICESSNRFPSLLSFEVPGSPKDMVHTLKSSTMDVWLHPAVQVNSHSVSLSKSLLKDYANALKEKSK